MTNLRRAMTEHGFESNDDYEFQVRCLLEEPTRHIRTLSIEGDSDRRKTAFAHALAQALEFPHLLYYDFTEQDPPPPEIILPPSKDELGREEPPIAPLDDIASKACALSEAEKTVLILDQLQAADFREHIRIHRLVKERRWTINDAPFYAKPSNLLLFLISDEPLYHSLKRYCFRVWISRVSERRIDFRPGDFGLGSDAAPLLGALIDLFSALNAAPTRSELARILDDLQLRVVDEDHLRHSIFGRCEGLSHQALRADPIAPLLSRVIETLRHYLGTEHIELSSG
ncbi:hypothetical protein [Rhabdochromatium marinum]|uniref:hypothetical protein n=1 Tax=Rhabdochromatium marinum TaxID=48729 RepID=UPI001902D262|nr:hypothetical protein [Rhabdochromatium marinum]MBK1648429.1 hypothetical protein [Rhabdochromatium marinum]